MKKIFITLAIILGIFIPQSAHADEFREISIEANIDEKGIGSIEEIWKINETNEDYTERYKTINNLRGLKIEDFSLEAFGKTFENRDPWDTDLDFNEKAYKSGVITRDEDEVELCWGISNYSDNTYKLKYKINPLAIGLKDSDMVFFTFVGDNFDPEPEKVNIKITGYKPFTDIKFWAFGLRGAIHEENGQIILESTGDVSYTTVMVKFPKGTFATSYREDKNFADYAKRHFDNFKNNLKNVAKEGGNALGNERGKLLRRYDQLRSEITTYENNLGFFNTASKKGNSLVEEMNRKIEKLKADLEMVKQKIKAIDAEKK